MRLFSLMIGFLLLGKSLENRAKRRALAALDSLSRLRPVTARRIRAGKETIVPLDEIQIGDSVLILPGERFPVDAEILEGRTTVDESMLPGEPTPQPREPAAALRSTLLARPWTRRPGPRCWGGGSGQGEGRAIRSALVLVPPRPCRCRPPPCEGPAHC